MHILKRQIGPFVVILMSLSPLISWYFAMSPFRLRFINAFSTYTTFGQISSLVGFAMFSLDLCLSTRLEFFEDFFGGMDRVYVIHHVLGGLAFICFMLHPVFLASAYLTYSPHQAAMMFLPGLDWARNTGIAALGFMMAILLLTFYRTIPYNIWRLLHQLLGAVFFVGVIHSFFIPSDISRDPMLRYHMLFFVVIGAIAYMYRTVFGSLLVRHSQYVLVMARQLNKNVVEISLRPAKRPLSYKPGQYVFVSFRDPSISKEVHPFSISSASTENMLVLTIKAEGDYTSQLVNLSSNALAVVEGAFGRFTYRNFTNRHQVWIAGGIGITPFFSMAKELASTPDYAVDLYYSVHDPEEAVYLTDLQNLAEKNPSFRVIPYVSTVSGRLSAAVIEKMSNGLGDKDFFLCGPPPMMHSMTQQLAKKGVKPAHVHFEEFQL